MDPLSRAYQQMKVYGDAFVRIGHGVLELIEPDYLETEMQYSARTEDILIIDFELEPDDYFFREMRSWPEKPNPAGLVTRLRFTFHRGQTAPLYPLEVKTYAVPISATWALGKLRAISGDIVQVFTIPSQLGDRVSAVIGHKLDEFEEEEL